MHTVKNIMLGLGLSLTLLAYADIQPSTVPSSLVTEVYSPQENAIAGNPKGHVILVDFFDYNCSYCRQLNSTLKPFLAAHGDVKIVFKEYLLLGSRSEIPSYAALSANRQGKYLEMHNALLSSTKPLTREQILALATQIHLNIPRFEKDLADPKLKAQIKRNGELAQAIHLQAAPTIFAANSKILKDPTQKQYELFFPLNSDTLDQITKLAEGA